MTESIKKVSAVFSVILALLVVVFLALRTPDTDAETMHAKYGGDSPLFAKTANGLSVHYRDQGCMNCPALILVHGSNASLHTFEPLVDKLKNRFRLISYDQPGHGLTGPHPRDDYSASGMIEALAVVIRTTGVERYTIVGHSMGGWVSWRYALGRPDGLSSLVLISASGAPAPPDAEKPKLYLGARILRHPLGRFLGRHIAPRSVFRKSLLGNVVDETFVTDTMVDRYWELSRYPGNRRATGIRVTTDREPHYGQRLGELDLPTLILWGSEDQVVLPHNAQTFNSMMPNSSLQIFDDIGHLGMEEAPELTAAALDQFLGSLPSDR
jgi:pimeloyl-ACP methyl ester carboxylesterase